MSLFETNAAYTHYRTCNLCEAMCDLEIEVRGDILAIRGDKADPFGQSNLSQATDKQID